MDFILVIVIIIFLIGLAIAYLVGYKSGAFKKHKEWEAELPTHRRDAILKSRAVLSGQFSEQLAPFLPDFNFKPTECRFIGKPIDFLVFKGMDERDINEIVFVEVKSGDSKLSPIEKKVKDAIKKKKVSWEEYRIPKKLTKGKEIKED